MLFLHPSVAMCIPVVFTLPVRSALLSTRAEIIIDVGIYRVAFGRAVKSVVGCHCVCEGDLRWYLAVVESRSRLVNRQFCLSGGTSIKGVLSCFYWWWWWWERK